MSGSAPTRAGMRRRVDLAWADHRARRRIPGRTHHRSGSRSRAEHLGLGRRIQGRQVSRLLTTQVPGEPMLCDRIVLIDGALRHPAEGTADELKQRTGRRRS